MIFLPDNPVITSSRRLRRGLFYNLVVSFGFYYLLGCSLNRLTGRTVIGTAPPFRTERELTWLALVVQSVVTAAACIAIFLVASLEVWLP